MQSQESNISEIKFNKDDLVPAIAQDWKTGDVLMLAYMNREAIEKTISTGRAHYFSRSREKLWLKGETSGHFQEVKSIYYDCDGDTILLKVEQKGVACHTGERTCFFRKFDKPSTETEEGPSIISELYRVVLERRAASPDVSYVASLYAKGLEGILEKVREESEEFIEASRGSSDKEIIHELADLLFHSLVLFGSKDIPLEKLFLELRKRFGTSGIEEKSSRKEKGGIKDE
jgi:phosphoribosyl-ATP pyrophosphohydrolase/phosphoribosyl-AMP cyclohydrolase